MIDHLKFILAGKATFTLTRPDGKHYTYRVNKKADRPGDAVWFISVGISYSDSIYLGMIVYRNGQPRFDLTKASKAGPGSPSVATFRTFFECLTTEGVDTAIRFQHEGRCCVCARPLTNPESIDAGIGPECAGKEH